MNLRRRTGGWAARIHTGVFAVALCTGLTLALAGCAGSGEGVAAGSQTYFSPTKAIGNGTGRSFVTMDVNNIPTAIGIEINEGARAGLPISPPPTFATEYVFASPQQIAATPFTQVSIFYTQGHPPDNIYGVPHYHPIFSLVTPAERAQIVFGGSAGAAPDPTAVPAGYISENFVLPGIGNIYANPNNITIKSLPFNTTDYDFGYFNGKMSSMNMTVAQQWLDLHGKVTYPIDQPQAYRTSGYYPTTYTVEYDSDTQVYRFSLGNFVHR
ncbi:MAG TPA: hypothetical protein VKU00_01425 [Chthonomonadaceae bacterium]|nr:hypothetical protein [Chthonomonadaceae bacterium]